MLYTLYQVQDDYLDSYIDARRDGQSDGEALLSVANSAGEAEDTVRASLVRQVEALLPEYEGTSGEQRLRAYLSAWRAAGTQAEGRVNLLLALTPRRPAGNLPPGASGSDHNGVACPGRGGSGSGVRPPQ